ncbi:MAG: UGSC family (seleno)protein [Candidatus Latescibacteria bacterium]|nr:UGSC family (seleno)protein [Candidatus Latescibacterota bacterium]
MPTASVQTDAFELLVKASSLQQGIPYLRQVYVPQPVMGQSPATLRGYIDGPDAITGRPFMDEVFDVLTKPLTEDETKQLSFDRSTPRFVDADTEDNLNQLFLDQNWTDKLPIVLPTEEHVEKMLAGTSHDPDEVVGHLRPTSTREAWEYTVEKVAVNAVMAGARPEYFPVILALAATQTSARASTTSSAAAMAVVNGPIRHEIDMNWGTGAMGPYNHANATIGRAYGLLSQNLQGGSVPAITYLGSQGNNYAYNSVTFAENEERSPWVPFHAQHGFKADESVVSTFSGCRSTAFTLGLRDRHWQDHVRNMLRGIDPHQAATFVLDPITAQLFVDKAGFDTVDKLIDWAYENATMPASQYWDYQLIQNYVHPRALNGVEPYATKLKAADDEMIPMFKREQIHVVVTGGETNGYWRIMGGNYSRSASVDAWR